jgi:hypothetical protein
MLLLCYFDSVHSNDRRVVVGRWHARLDCCAGLQPFCAAVQALKIIRYTARLIAAVSPPGSEQRQRFEALQSSVGTSRCACDSAALTMLTCQQHY